MYRREVGSQSRVRADVFSRIERQCVLAQCGVPVAGLEDVPLGLYDLTHCEVRLGNIVAMAQAALDDRYCDL